jgi:hypothetical protein
VLSEWQKGNIKMPPSYATLHGHKKKNSKGKDAARQDSTAESPTSPTDTGPPAATDAKDFGTSRFAGVQQQAASASSNLSPSQQLGVLPSPDVRSPAKTPPKILDD